MAAKKTPKKTQKEMVLVKSNEEMMTGIIAISDLAARYTEDVGANVTVDNLDKAVEVLARVREAGRKLKVVYDKAVEKIKADLKPYDTEKKSLAAKLEAADKAVSDKLVDMYVNLDEDGRSAIDKKLAGAMGSTATFVHRGYEITVTNAELVPDDYILPPAPRSARVNAAAIEAVINAGLAVPPGVSVKRRVSITTRAADTIKRVAAK